MKFILSIIFAILCFSAVHGSTEYIKMRDGVELTTYIEFPDNFRGENATTVMCRTPYTSFGCPSTVFTDKGMISVIQVLRGAALQYGKYELFRTEANDTEDTMKWIGKQPWSNGKVTMYGRSAAAISAILGAGNGPKEYAGLVSSVGVADLYSMALQGGVPRKSLMNRWLSVILEGQAIKTLYNHQQYGPYWYSVNLDQGNKFQHINYPTLHDSGWFDIFQQASIRAWMGYNTKSSAPGLAKLIVDPLGHCGGGAYEFPDARKYTSPLEKIGIDMFLATQQTVQNSLYDALPNVTWYVMSNEGATKGGSGDFGNYWTNGDSFPQYKVASFYFTPNRTMTRNAIGGTNSVSYIYDPEDPVPAMGGNNLLELYCANWDQSDYEEGERDDVLTFTSPAFNEHFAITGPVKAVLYASTNCTDTDFTVKYTDLYSDGTSMLIQDGIVRMKWVESREHMTLLQPGKVYKAEVDLLYVSYIFNPGHKLRVSISSSNDPRFKPNLNNGRLAKYDSPVIVAENSIWMGSEHPSRIELPEVSLDQIPPKTISGF